MKMQWMVAAVALALSACGGGGGGGSSGPAQTLEDLQGFWTGNVSGPGLGADKVRAVVLDDGAAWLFLHDASKPGEPLVGLARGTLAASGSGYTGSGTRYPAGGVPTGVNFSGSGIQADSLELTVTGPAGNATATGLAYGDQYETPATQAAVAGNWRFTLEAGSKVGTWNVAADGTLTGSSTTGCVYTGRVVPHAKPVAVYEVAVKETCGITVIEEAGIARLNSTGDFLTLGLTTGDAQAGEAFAVQRVTNPS